MRGRYLLNVLTSKEIIQLIIFSIIMQMLEVIVPSIICIFSEFIRKYLQTKSKKNT